MAKAVTALHELERRIGYQFRDPQNLIGALTHSSAIDAAQPRVGESLEFLGDAVLGLVFSDLLIEHYPVFLLILLHCVRQCFHSSGSSERTFNLALMSSLLLESCVVVVIRP